MNVNEIIEFVKDGYVAIQPTINLVVEALLITLFLRNNTKTTEFEKIKAGKFQEVIDELLQTGKMTYLEFYRTKNFLKIAKIADSYMNDDTMQKTSKGIEQKYDFDWFVKFFDMAGNVSDEYMQDIWARVLAGEVNNSNSFSYKTLEILKTINSDDAILFMEVCSKAISIGENRLFLPSNEEYLNAVGVEYDKIMRLSELGLIYSDIKGLEGTTEDNSLICFLSETLFLKVVSYTPNKVINLGQFPLTFVGKEIAKIFNARISDKDFIEFAKSIKSDKSYQVSVHRIVKKENDRIDYDEIDLLM